MAEGEGDGSLSQELQVLESIYLDELRISHGERPVLSITLHPATGHDAESQYVRFTLQLTLPPQYPAEPPHVSVCNPRGLCDEQIHSIISTLKALATQDTGSPILYELIEKGKEMLTDSNLPHGQCAICLYGFQDGESLTKTLCFHHFHSHCLGQYADHCQKSSDELASLHEPSILCPVCRENLTCDVLKLKAALPPQHAEMAYVPDAGALQKRKELKQIYENQLLKGGIIDPETEKKRFFISIQDVPGHDHLEPQTQELTSLQPGQDLVTSVQHKPRQPSGDCVQTPGMKCRPLHADQRGARPLQPGSREWTWQSRARSETNPSQHAARTTAREETRPTRSQVSPVSDRFKHRGPRTFRASHQSSWGK